MNVMTGDLLTSAQEMKDLGEDIFKNMLPRKLDDPFKAPLRDLRNALANMHLMQGIGEAFRDAEPHKSIPEKYITETRDALVALEKSGALEDASIAELVARTKRLAVIQEPVSFGFAEAIAAGAPEVAPQAETPAAKSTTADDEFSALVADLEQGIADALNQPEPAAAAELPAEQNVLADPANFSRNVVANDLMLKLFGDSAIQDGKLDAFNELRQKAAGMQAEALAAHQNIDTGIAIRLVNSGIGMPKGVPPFSEFMRTASDGAWPKDYVKGDLAKLTLDIQAAGRIIALSEGTLGANDVPVMRVFDDSTNVQKAYVTLYTAANAGPLDLEMRASAMADAYHALSAAGTAIQSQYPELSSTLTAFANEKATALLDERDAAYGQTAVAEAEAAVDAGNDPAAPAAPQTEDAYPELEAKADAYEAAVFAAQTKLKELFDSLGIAKDDDTRNLVAGTPAYRLVQQSLNHALGELNLAYASDVEAAQGVIDFAFGQVFSHETALEERIAQAQKDGAKVDAEKLQGFIDAVNEAMSAKKELLVGIEETHADIVEKTDPKKSLYLAAQMLSRQIQSAFEDVNTAANSVIDYNKGGTPNPVAMALKNTLRDTRDFNEGVYAKILRVAKSDLDDAYDFATSRESLTGYINSIVRGENGLVANLEKLKTAYPAVGSIDTALNSLSSVRTGTDPERWGAVTPLTALLRKHAEIAPVWHNSFNAVADDLKGVVATRTSGKDEGKADAVAESIRLNLFDRADALHIMAGIAQGAKGSGWIKWSTSPSAHSGYKNLKKLIEGQLAHVNGVANEKSGRAISAAYAGLANAGSSVLKLVPKAAPEAEPQPEVQAAVETAAEETPAQVAETVEAAPAAAPAAEAAAEIQIPLAEAIAGFEKSLDNADSAMDVVLEGLAESDNRKVAARARRIHEAFKAGTARAKDAIGKLSSSVDADAEQVAKLRREIDDGINSWMADADALITEQLDATDRKLAKNSNDAELQKTMGLLGIAGIAADDVSKKYALLQQSHAQESKAVDAAWKSIEPGIVQLGQDKLGLGEADAAALAEKLRKDLVLRPDVLQILAGMETGLAKSDKKFGWSGAHNKTVSALKALNGAAYQDQYKAVDAAYDALSNKGAATVLPVRKLKPDVAASDARIEPALPVDPELAMPIFKSRRAKPASPDAAPEAAAPQPATAETQNADEQPHTVQKGQSIKPLAAKLVGAGTDVAGFGAAVIRAVGRKWPTILVSVGTAVYMKGAIVAGTAAVGSAAGISLSPVVGAVAAGVLIGGLVTGHMSHYYTQNLGDQKGFRNHLRAGVKSAFQTLNVVRTVPVAATALYYGSKDFVAAYRDMAEKNAAYKAENNGKGYGFWKRGGMVMAGVKNSHHFSVMMSMLTGGIAAGVAMNYADEIRSGVSTAMQATGADDAIRAATDFSAPLFTKLGQLFNGTTEVLPVPDPKADVAVGDLDTTPRPVAVDVFTSQPLTGPGYADGSFIRTYTEGPNAGMVERFIKAPGNGQAGIGVITKPGAEPQYYGLDAEGKRITIDPAASITTQLENGEVQVYLDGTRKTLTLDAGNAARGTLVIELEGKAPITQRVKVTVDETTGIRTVTALTPEEIRHDTILAAVGDRAKVRAFVESSEAFTKLQQHVETLIRNGTIKGRDADLFTRLIEDSREGDFRALNDLRANVSEGGVFRGDHVRRISGMPIDRLHDGYALALMRDVQGFLGADSVTFEGNGYRLHQQMNAAHLEGKGVDGKPLYNPNAGTRTIAEVRDATRVDVAAGGVNAPATVDLARALERGGYAVRVDGATGKLFVTAERVAYVAPAPAFTQDPLASTKRGLSDFFSKFGEQPRAVEIELALVKGEGPVADAARLTQLAMIGRGETPAAINTLIEQVNANPNKAVITKLYREAEGFLRASGNGRLTETQVAFLNRLQTTAKLPRTALTA